MMAWAAVSFEIPDPFLFFPLPFFGSVGGEFSLTNMLYYADGFFDAGMLQLALKASQDEKVATGLEVRRPAVGKKLRLGDY